MKDIDAGVMAENREALMQAARQYQTTAEGYIPMLAAVLHLIAIASGDEQQVYFVQAGQDGPLKVGIAYDVRGRVKSLQTASPYELRLLGSVPGGRRAEEFLHEVFRRYRMRGEWFEPNEALISIVLDMIAGFEAFKRGAA